MIQLSERLRTIAEKVKPGSRVADIGSDHALLPVYLVQQGTVEYAVAGELNPGPYEAASKQVREAGLSVAITVRRGNGLEVVQPGECDTVTIAGMGGNLIVDILEAGRANGKLAGVETLVLQPNVGEEAVRRWLYANGYKLRSEHILEEDGKIYEVLQAEHTGEAGAGSDLYQEQELRGFGRLSVDDFFRFGPFLLRKAESVFLEKWLRETGKLERIAASLAQSDLEESRIKRMAVLKDAERIKELIACLLKDKPSFN